MTTTQKQNIQLLKIAKLGNGSEAEANARLIAAAPEMFEALAEVERELSFATLGAFNNLAFMSDGPTKQALVKARAVLAKAGGGN